MRGPAAQQLADSSAAERISQILREQRQQDAAKRASAAIREDELAAAAKALMSARASQGGQAVGNAAAAMQLLPGEESLPSIESLSASWRPPANEPFPRVLHQSWRSHHVPPRLAGYMRTWRERSPPGWAFKLHTDADNAALVQSRYAWLEPAFLQMNAIQQADVARLLYMHAFGGVYADLDVELLQPLDGLLAQSAAANSTALVGQEPLAHAVLLERQPRQICNAVLASARGHPFWLWALHMAALYVRSDGGWGDPVGSTGPRMLEKAVNKWQLAQGRGFLGLTITPPDAFFPLWDAMQQGSFQERCLEDSYANDTEIVQAGLSEQVVSTCARLRSEGFVPTVPADGSAYAAHHWAHSWMEGFSDGFQEDKERDVLMLDRMAAAAVEMQDTR